MLVDAHELDDVVCMFHEMVRVRLKPSVIEYNKLLTVVGKIKHFDVTLLMFGEVLQLVILDDYTINVSINCYFQLN